MVVKNWTIRYIFLFLVVDFVLAGHVFAEEKAVGKVIGISGTIEFLGRTSEEPVAEVQPGEVRPVSFEKWSPAKFQQAVFASDQFRTFSKSRLKILLIDNSLIALGPNSQMTVQSYLHKPKDKLRQGIIGLAHGLSMYIINKSQSHKKSTFEIVTPTANIAARGTQGYVSAAPENTFVANKVGIVVTSNVNPSVTGSVDLGPGMGNNIPKDQPPTPAQQVSPGSFADFNTVIVLGASISGEDSTSGGGGPLIEVQGPVEEMSGQPVETTASNTEFQQEFFSTSEAGVLGEFFAPVNDPFPVAQLESCSR